MRWAVLGPTPGSPRRASMSCVRRAECFDLSMEGHDHRALERRTIAPVSRVLFRSSARRAGAGASSCTPH